MPVIYVLRHGETEWNKIGRFQGALDSPLTDKGKLQAAKVAKILHGELGPAPKYQIISSPRGRALETAGIIADVLNLPIATDNRLAEITMGEWDGLTYPEIVKGWREALFNATEEDWHFHSPSGESYDSVYSRVSSWLADMQENTIAVSHGLSGKLLRGCYAGLDRETTLSLPEPQDAVFRLRDRRIDLLR